jgi:hypothetical protein
VPLAHRHSIETQNNKTTEIMPSKKIMVLDKPASVRIHEVGRLFKGHPKGISANGKRTIGRDYNSHYLRFEPEVRFKNEPSEHGFSNLYDELKDRWEKLISRQSVSVKLPFSKLEECLFLDNSVIINWGTGTKKAASCDGTTCTLSFKTEKVNGKNQHIFDRNPKPCMVGTDGICPMGCAPKALLKLIIPDLYPGGIVVFPLGSPIDIDSVRGTLARFQQYPLNGIPFSLFRKATRVNYSDDRGDQSRDNWGVNLDIDPIVASKLMAKTERRFERFLESDDEMIEAEIIPQQRSIAPSAIKSPNFKTSDDGFNFLQQLQAAMNEGSLELMSEALEIARDLVSSGYYDRSGLAWIDSEEDRARSAIRALQPATVPIVTPQKAAPTSAVSDQINFFRQKTESTTADIKAICDRLNLPKSSAEMSADQAIVLVGELLIEWAVEGQWIDREIALVLVSKSIEVTTTDTDDTDEDLWNDFTLRVEAFKNDTGAAK